MTDPFSLQQAAAGLLGPCELIAVLTEAVIRVEPRPARSPWSSST